MLEFHIGLGSGTEYGKRPRSISVDKNICVSYVGWAQSRQLILVSAFSW